MKRHPTLSKGSTSSCLLFISVLGLCFIAILTFGAKVAGTGYPWKKPLIGSIFGSICILGTLSAFFPSECTHILHLKKKNRGQTADESEPKTLGGTSPQFLGHHPDCGNFSAHVFLIGDRSVCAGCAGLALGAMVSLLGTFLYFFTNLFPTEAYSSIFWAGFMGVICGLLQYHLFRVERSFVHMLLNFIFVLGALLLLVGADAIANSLPLAIYILALDVFWIYTRIELSRWDHQIVCGDCGLQTCPRYLRRSL